MDNPTGKTGVSGEAETEGVAAAGTDAMEGDVHGHSRAREGRRGRNIILQCWFPNINRTACRTNGRHWRRLNRLLRWDRKPLGGDNVSHSPPSLSTNLRPWAQASKMPKGTTTKTKLWLAMVFNGTLKVGNSEFRWNRLKDRHRHHAGASAYVRETTNSWVLHTDYPTKWHQWRC